MTRNGSKNLSVLAKLNLRSYMTVWGLDMKSEAK